MGKIRIADLAKMMAISYPDLVYKLHTIGVEVSKTEVDPAIDTDVIQAILRGEKLPRQSTISADKPPSASIRKETHRGAKVDSSIEKQKKELEIKTSFRAFLCHTGLDKPAVRNLYQRLLVDGIYPWLDEEELLPGQNWRREIEKTLRGIPAVIVCLSRNSTTKQGYVQKEVGAALDLLEEHPEDSIFIIPARLEECEVPERLSHLHYCDLYRDSGYNRLLLALHFRARQLGLTINGHVKTSKDSDRTNSSGRY